MKEKNIKALVVWLVLSLAAWAWAGGDLEAWLDRTTVGLGETVQLSIKAEGGISGEPDTAPLANDFQVQGTSSSSSINIANGAMRRATTWQITLQPKREGTLAVPSLSIDGRRTPPLTLTVSAAPAPQADAGADIFVETEVLPDNPYVGQQVIYQVRLFHAVDIAEGDLSAPQPDNAVVQQLGKDRRYEANRKGRHYQVIERTYALFPQQAGKLAIAPPVFSGKVVETARSRDPFDSFFNNDPFGMFAQTRPVRVTGQADTLEVRPRPPEAGAGTWLPADSVTIAEEWQPDRASLRVGEAITRTVTVRALGQTGTALPELAPGAVEGFRLYPDKAEVNTAEADGGLTGTSRQKTAYIPVKPGKYTLPAVTLPWWDLRAKTMKQATLPARTITVLPGDAPAAATAQPEPPPQTGNRPEPSAGKEQNGRMMPEAQLQQGRHFPWALLALALGTGWLCTLMLWGLDRRRRPGRAIPAGSAKVAVPAASDLRRAFLAACEKGEAGNARSALLRWAAAHWPDDPPKGLGALAERLDSPEAAAETLRLDRCLFGDTPQPWVGTRLAALVQQLPAGQGRAASPPRQALPPLYP